ncbi:hypothetical protein [Streptomyces sp. NPDC005423]|uniref:hypothetical protein n=1 Tax=Streptomyces sp. NPDC005423 TaxID=3155343 RepID=UPI0033A817DD
MDAAAVMIADARGELKTMATTDEEAAFAELLQMQNGRSPCMDCKGMLAQHTGATIAEAARLLSAYVHERRLRLTETAYALVTRALPPTVVAEARQR